MSEAVLRIRRLWRHFWPHVDNLDGAREGVKRGYESCVIAAGLSALEAAFGPRTGLAAAVSFAAAFAILGVFLHWRSRTAAVLATALTVVLIIVTLSQVPVIGLVTVIQLVCMLSAVRGTFAYWALLRKGADSSPRPTNQDLAA